MRSLLLRGKKILCVGGALALLVLGGSIFVAKQRTEEANASSTQSVTLGNLGWIQTTNNFTINGQSAWCVTPSLGTPVGVGRTVTRQATVYSLDELKAGVSNGYSIANIRKMFIAYYYTKETNAALFSNVEAMHWGLAHLYSGSGRNTGANAGQVWDNGQKAWPNNLASGSVTIVPAYNGTQAIFTANYETKEESQRLTVTKAWHDELDTHPNVDIHYQVRVKNGDVLYNDVLNEGNKWTKTYDDLTPGQEYEIIEDMSASGFTSTTLEDGSDETFWTIDALKDSENNPIYYFSPSEDTQKCTTSSDGLSATCTIYNDAYDYTGINLYLYKHWRDKDAANYRPDGVSFEVHAFRVDNNEDVTTQLPRLSGDDDYIYVYGWGDSPDKDIWGGRWIPELPTHIVIDEERYELYYAIREMRVPASYQVTCREGESIQVGNETYCKAVERPDGDLEVHWFNEEKFINFEVVKTWNDGGDILHKRPFMISFDIYQNGEFYTNIDELDPNYFEDEKSDVWVMSEQLPEFDPEGNRYVYTYQETEYYNWNSWTWVSEVYDIDKRIIGANDQDGMINTAITDIPVIKCWSNDDKSKRPDEMKFNLLVDGKVVDSISLTEEMNEDENGCWTGSFEELPLFDEDGEKIVYSVEEDPESLEDINYEVDIDICRVDVEDRVKNAAEGEEVDMGCYFTNRYVDVPKTSAKTMRSYWVIASAILVGGYFAGRKVFTRR